MSIETTMPPQYDLPQLSPPGTDDFNLFNNIFDELNLSFDDMPLFESVLTDFEHTDMLDEMFESSKVRHDCMWAGTCVADNKERPNPQERLQETPVKAASPSVVAPVCVESPSKDTESVLSPYTSVSSRAVSVKCNSRSLLRTNVNQAVSVASSDALRTASQDESDDSGRPETPQSMSSDTEAAESKLNSSVDEEDDEETEEDEEEEEEDDDDDVPGGAASVSEVTGQTVLTPLLQQQHHYDGRGHASRFDSRPQQTVSHHFFNDHSYHLSKSDVSASIPGNLTPSDSEDEIDVVSVCGEKSTSSSRSSSQGALPTNPSARDRQALQQSMATSLKRSASSAYPTFMSGRKPSGKLAKMHAERQRERKRRPQERDDSSDEDVRPTKKRAKHHHAYKPARNHRGSHHGSHHHAFRSASSDSEPDSCEKRSLHNNMERQRRVDLRNAFEDLRVVVPALSPNPRAAKVVILKEASHYCHQLTADSKSLQQESALLERERERLMARVSYLRKQVASIRMSM